MIKSKIYLSEIVENKEFRFGQNKQYQPVTFVYPDGTEKEGLMTIPSFSPIIERARRNPEDIPEDKTFIDFLLGR